MNNGHAIWTEIDAALHLRLCTQEDVDLAATGDMGSECARKRVGCARRKVRGYALRDAIPGAYKVGRDWRFRPADVEAAVDRWAKHGHVVDADGKAVSVRATEGISALSGQEGPK